MTDAHKNVQIAPERFVFSGRGTIYSYTTVMDAPEGYEGQAPYIVAIVQLDEGVSISAQLTDVDGEVRIGDRVEMVTRKLTTEGERGMIIYGYKFRPLLVG